MLFKNYEYFLTIVEERSVSLASRRLFMTQPALSQYLKRLENNLGVTLFDRTTSPLELTYAGERYLDYIKKCLALNKNIEQEFRDIHQKKRGKLRIGIAYWRSSIVLPEVLPEFYRLWPNIDLTIVEGSGDKVLNELRNEKLDFNIMNITTTMDFSDLILEEIFCEKILLAAPQNTILSESLDSVCPLNTSYPVINLHSLKNEKFILPKKGQNIRVIVDQLFNKHIFTPNVLLCLENTTTSLHLVSEGLGVCFVPESGTNSKYLPNNIKLYSLPDIETVWNLSIVYKRSHKLTQPISDFYKIAKEKLIIY